MINKQMMIITMIMNFIKKINNKKKTKYNNLLKYKIIIILYIFYIKYYLLILLIKIKIIQEYLAKDTVDKNEG